MRANVKSDWKGGEAYIIGGGASLRDFDFGSLEGRNTLGANDAFRLGPKRCSRTLFADHKWWRVVKWELEAYAKAGGIVYSVCPDTERFNLKWLLQFARIANGWSKVPGSLGLNYNTGAACVNLAVLLGATRIYLLGFDMTNKGAPGRGHWHNYRGHVIEESSYTRFIHGFEVVANSLKRYPEVKVFNVGDGRSRLPFFPKMAFKDMLKEVAA